jgi:signal transduction histidine kinase
MFHYLLFNQQIFWGFIFSTLAFIVIVIALASFFIFYHKKLKQLFQNNNELHKELLAMMVSSQDVEGKRITEELHDNIGGVLSVAGLYLDEAITNDGESCEEKQLLISKSRKLINEAVDHIRKVSYNIMPYSIGHSGFQGVLQNLFSKIVDTDHIQLTTHFERRSIKFSEERELMVYRIVKELILNILKYSHPNFIHIHQFGKNKNFILEITYDGNGLDQCNFNYLIREDGNEGLKKMISLMHMVGGELLLTNEEGIFKSFLKIPFESVKVSELEA